MKALVFGLPPEANEDANAGATSSMPAWPRSRSGSARSTTPGWSVPTG